MVSILWCQFTQKYLQEHSPLPCGGANMRAYVLGPGCTLCYK